MCKLLWTFSYAEKIHNWSDNSNVGMKFPCRAVLCVLSYPLDLSPVFHGPQVQEVFRIKKSSVILKVHPLAWKLIFITVPHHFITIYFTMWIKIKKYNISHHLFVCLWNELDFFYETCLEKYGSIEKGTMCSRERTQASAEIQNSDLESKFSHYLLYSELF